MTTISPRMERGARKAGGGMSDNVVNNYSQNNKLVNHIVYEFKQPLSVNRIMHEPVDLMLRHAQ